MVSVDEQSEYWKLLRANTFTCFFLDFLDAIPSLQPPPLNASDTLNSASNLLVYVRQGDASAAISLYQRLTARQAWPNSEWVHNDYFVFSLVCAVRKFQLDSRWLRSLLLHRPNVDQEQRLINKSFDNLIAGNYNAREDYHQVSMVCQLIVGEMQFDPERLHKMFAYLWRHPFPYFESEFLNIVSLRAIRLAFEAKGLQNPEQRFIAEQFAHQFRAKVSNISKAVIYPLYFLMVAVLALGAGFYAENTYVKTGLGVLAALGLGASAIADVRKWLIERTEKLIKRMFGYPF